MAEFSTLKDTVYDWIDGQALVPSENIVFQFQNEAIPDKPFFSLRIMSMVQIGDANITKATSGLSDQRNITTTYDFTLEILGFGPDIVEKTHLLRNSLNVPEVHEQLADGSVISWNNTNLVLDISGLDGEDNEERSSYDANMRTTEVIEDISVGQISIVNAVGTIKQDGKPDTIINFNIDTTI